MESVKAAPFLIYSGQCSTRWVLGWCSLDLIFGGDLLQKIENSPGPGYGPGCNGMAPNDIYCCAIYKTCKSEQRGHHHPTMPGIVTFLKRFLPNFPIKIALWTNAKHIIITVALTRPSVWIKCPINDFYLDFIIQFYLCPGIYLEWLSGHFNSSSPSILLALIFTHTIISGIRAFHPDGDPGDAAGGIGDWSRLHIRHQEAAAHDHLRRGEGAHTGECWDKSCESYRQTGFLLRDLKVPNI